MKVIAFPFAGGNKYSYNFLNSFLAPFNISMEVFEYSGRGDRINESLCDSIDSIVKDLLPRVLKRITEEDDYIIYGHSMGALVGYLINCKIEELSFKNPLRLIVSGRKSPSTEREQKISQLLSDEFWIELIKLGGIPDEIEKLLRDFFEPILRADFQVVENYTHKTDVPLKIPIDVLYGNEELENESDFQNWKKETTNIVELKEFNGNHFFIYEHAQDIANHFIRTFQIGTQS